MFRRGGSFRRLTYMRLVILAALLAFVMVSCGDDEQAADAQDATETQPAEATETWPKSGTGGSLVVTNWGGEAEEGRKGAIYPGFEEATGTEINSLAGPIEYGRIKAMVDAGRTQWDVVTASSPFYILGEDYFESIDYERNPEVWEGVVGATPYTTPEFIGCEALVYSTDAFPEGTGPTNWQDFWDTEGFPGKRALGADGGVPYYTLETAILATGASADEVYPIDYDVAFDMLDKLRSTGDLEIWSSYADATQMLASGSVVMARMSVAPLWDLITSGKLAVNWTNPICYSENNQIVKGTESYDQAMNYVEYIVDPKRQAELAMISHNGPVTPKALEFIPEDIQEYLPVPPDKASTVVWHDYEFYGSGYDELVERWDKWRLEG